MGWFKGGGNVYIAMEYFENGDLGRYIRNPRSEEDAKSIVKQLLEGLKFMHLQGIAHRDLKPEV
jgi:serine/threonine protein kinase